MGMRTLLEVLFVRSNPERFCCGITGAPHAIAILLGEIIEGNQDWRAEVSGQDPGVVLVDPLDFPVHIWWVDWCTRGPERVVRQKIKEGLPAWCSGVNPGVKEEYFQLWRTLNMLYEQLSLPWRLLRCPEGREPIRGAMNRLYYDIGSRWVVRKGNI